MSHLTLLLLALVAPQHMHSFSPSISTPNLRVLPRHKITSLFASTSNEEKLDVSSSQLNCNRRQIVTRAATGVAALFIATSENANAESSAKVAVSSETKLSIEAKTQPTPSKSPSADKPSPKSSNKLENPGDVKNCSDFENYKDAKTWFDKYYDLYGDVAKLDKNNNLIPCEALPGAPPNKSK